MARTIREVAPTTLPVAAPAAPVSQAPVAPVAPAFEVIPETHSVEVRDGKMTIVIDVSQGAFTRAPLSKSGATRLLAVFGPDDAVKLFGRKVTLSGCLYFK